MKILHVAPYFAPAWGYGGTPRAVFELARAQAQAGHQVTVLTTDVLNQSERTDSGHSCEAGFTVIRVPNWFNWLAWRVHLVTPKYLPSLILKLLEDPSVVVHLHEVRTILNWMVVRQLRGQPVTLSAWGTLPHHQSKSWAKKIYDLIFLPTILKSVALGTGQTQHECRVLVDHGVVNTAIIPLGVDTSFFQHLPSRTAARQFFSLDKKNQVVGYLGRFSPYKGLSELITAFELNWAKNHQLRLLLVGRDDGFAPQLQQLVANSPARQAISINPPLYDQDRLLLYQAADIFVSVPTVYEETATTCLEALCCGCPVITNHFAQIPMIKRSQGVFHISGGSGALAAAMKSALSTSRQVAVDHVRSTFDWASCAQLFITKYEGLFT